jgi:hypothetical protein
MAWPGGHTIRLHKAQSIVCAVGLRYVQCDFHDHEFIAGGRSNSAKVVMTIVTVVTVITGTVAAIFGTIAPLVIVARLLLFLLLFILIRIVITANRH